MYKPKVTINVLYKGNTVETIKRKVFSVKTEDYCIVYNCRLYTVEQDYIGSLCVDMHKPCKF